MLSQASAGQDSGVAVVARDAVRTTRCLRGLPGRSSSVTLWSDCVLQSLLVCQSRLLSPWPSSLVQYLQVLLRSHLQTSRGHPPTRHVSPLEPLTRHRSGTGRHPKRTSRAIYSERRDTPIPPVLAPARVVISTCIPTFSDDPAAY